MPNLTKTAVKRLLVEERMKERAKAKQSRFMSKTLSIYNGQKKRAAEAGQALDFSLADFRAFFLLGINGNCPYSGQRLSLSNATADHRTPIARGGSFGLANQVVCTQSSNFQKGLQTEEEHLALMKAAAEILAPVALEDLKRRLTLGGKWGFR